jgi:hypothetical protein
MHLLCIEKSEQWTGSWLHADLIALSAGSTRYSRAECPSHGWFLFELAFSKESPEL